MFLYVVCKPELKLSVQPRKSKIWELCARWGTQHRAYKPWVTVWLKKLSSSSETSTWILHGKGVLCLYFLLGWLLQNALISSGIPIPKHVTQNWRALRDNPWRAHKNYTHIFSAFQRKLSMHAENINTWPTAHKLTKTQWLEVKDKQIMPRN